MRSLLAPITFLLAAVGGLRGQETIEPGPYYPAYPGSQWTYVDQAGDTVTDSVSSRYQAFEWKGRGQVNVPFLATSHWSGFHKILRHLVKIGERSYLPILGDLVPVEECNRHRACSQTTKGIYSLDPAKGWHFSVTPSELSRCDQNYHCSIRRAVAIDTTLVLGGKVYDSVILMRTTYRSNAAHDSIDEYFAKGVGLVRASGCYWKDTEKLDSIECNKSLTLIDHLIRTPKRRQAIRVDSLRHVRTGRSRPAWSGGIPPPGDAPTQAVAWMSVQGPGSDTLALEARATSGLPLFITLEGSGTHLGEGRFAFPRGFGEARVTLRQPGDTAFEAAPEFRGTLCLAPKVVLHPDTVDGRVRIRADWDGRGRWFWGDGKGAPSADLGIAGPLLEARGAGNYFFAPISPAQDGECQGEGPPSESITLAGTWDPAKSPRPLPWQKVLVLGVPAMVPVSGSPHPRLQARIHRLDGEEVPVRLVGGPVELQVVPIGRIRPGAYTFRICEGGVCRSGRVARVDGDR